MFHRSTNRHPSQSTCELSDQVLREQSCTILSWIVRGGQSDELSPDMKSGRRCFRDRDSLGPLDDLNEPPESEYRKSLVSDVLREQYVHDCEWIPYGGYR
jgi:hypothetical protein